VREGLFLLVLSILATGLGLSRTCYEMFRYIEDVAMHRFGVIMMLMSVTSSEKCFHCGDDERPACTDRMTLSLSDLDADTVCLNLGSCVKFNGTAIIVPGLHFFAHRGLGVAAQSTLGVGTTFLVEKYV